MEVAIRLFLFAVSFLSIASGASQRELADAESAYLGCARQMALKLNPSGESPEEIAKTAVAQCQTEGAAEAFNIIVENSATTDLQSLQNTAEKWAYLNIVFARHCHKPGPCQYRDPSAR